MRARWARSTDVYKRVRAEFREQCEAEDARCWLCGQPIDYDALPGTAYSFEADHFYPASTHPEHLNDPANLKPSHKHCNSSRGNGAPRAGLGTISRDWLRSG
ncbi:HNH endonuclease [Agromyces sp. NPDC058484]|uniref:HNH endonuclease n=1 Tax=Agromyces sp. NPDC058484 TaxID=3346524 RepID=UPI0036578CE0